MNIITLERQGTSWTPVEDWPFGGLVGFISWSRLIYHLERTGEIKPTEEVEHLLISERGIEYTVVRRHP